MKIEESNLFGMTVIHAVEDDCPFCGREMTNVVFYGTVCTHNDCREAREKAELEEDKLTIIKYLKLENTTDPIGALHIQSVVRYLGYRHGQIDHVLKAVESLVSDGLVNYQEESLSIIK